MKFDEFAFVNQQLAGMLKSGIPLEGALKQLCATMKRGGLRKEFEALEADLAQGAPLREALGRRSLPPFYVAMAQVGVAGNDLPGVLTLLADYYQRVSTTWTRLKGLMVYPLIVLVAALALSFVISSIFSQVSADISPTLRDMFVFDDLPERAISHSFQVIQLWVAPTALAVLVAVFLAGLAVPFYRARLRWRLPGFREAGLAQLASAFALMLRRGVTLDDALRLLRSLEGDSPAGRELAHWQERLQQGHSKLADMASGSRVFPPLFVWLVGSGGEDAADGFQRAAEIFHARALHRIELLLYGFLPVSVLVLGLMIVGQMYPLVMELRRFMFLGD